LTCKRNRAAPIGSARERLGSNPTNKLKQEQEEMRNHTSVTGRRFFKVVAGI
jgi:hypothetical protein